MQKIPFVKAKFITTAVKESDWPNLTSTSGKPLLEIAVAGRSNVGKSSLLNHLFGSTKLVKTSSTPGKTQAINFFTIDDKLAFADLPGYGYAQVPLSVKRSWGPMIQEYLFKRKTLKLILFLLDIRRTPNEEDRQFVEWVSKSDKGMIVVLTKTDKVNQSEKEKNTRTIMSNLGAMNLHYLYYSVPKNKGRRELISMIHDALQEE